MPYPDGYTTLTAEDQRAVAALLDHEPALREFITWLAGAGGADYALAERGTCECGDRRGVDATPLTTEECLLVYTRWRDRR